MKKTASVLLCLALVWTGSGALAQYIMTGEEMHAIWQESFDKMNTEGALDIRTLDDLAAFEAEYTRRTGNERKEDLVFESLPMEGDMPYDEALSYARGLIADKFGTPESELDAMGVYPRLVDYIYMDHESEWEFYFTPRRDTDIHLDHSYDAPGEYRVVFGARTGTVEYVNWYLDGFFPHYALRTWEAGKYEYVYQKALGKAFYEQSVENQQAFERRFEEKGYDTAPIKRTDEELLAAIGTELMFAEPAENLLSSGDAQVEAALAALEKETGLTKAMLETCGYAAVRSPLDTGSRDICFAYNYNIESGRYETGELSSYSGRLMSYASRLGLYMVKLDPESGRAVKVVYAPRSKQAVEAQDETLLLGRREWTADDLPEFEAALARLTALDERALKESQPDYMLLEAQCDAIMREIGGDPALYSARLEADTDLGLESARLLAWKAVCEATGLTQEEAQAVYGCEGQYDIQGMYTIWFWQQGQPDASGYFVAIDAATGEVRQCEYTESGGNG